MKPRDILLSAAAIFLLAGLILGLRSHGVGDGYEAADCGSVFKPAKDVGTLDGITGNDTPADCSSSLSGAKPLTYGALGLAGIAFIAAFVAPERKLTT